MNNDTVLAEIHQLAAKLWEESSTLTDKIADFLQVSYTSPDGRALQAMSTPRVGITPHGDKIYYVRFLTSPTFDFEQMEESAVLLIETEAGKFQVLRTHEIPSRREE